MPSATWASWIDTVLSDAVENVTISALSAVGSGRIYRFTRVRNRRLAELEVREGCKLPQFGGRVSRATCTKTGEEFDLRRYSSSGALVDVAAMEALDRELKILAAVGRHPCIAGLRAQQLVDNSGGVHSRWLLCDACVTDLSSELARRPGGAFEAAEAAELGRQLSLGLAHLHGSLSCGIVCGSRGLAPEGVLVGSDGCWKISDFGGAAELPLKHGSVEASHWLAQWSSCSAEDVPPECRDCNGIPTAVVDVWLLGRLLATALLGRVKAGNMLIHQRGSEGGTLVNVDGSLLLDPLAAHLWLLLHCLLAAEPSHRPGAVDVATACADLEQVTPLELLVEMPCTARFHCSSFAATCARALAMQSIAASLPDAGERKAAVGRLAGLPMPRFLEALEGYGVSPWELERVCQNCAVVMESGDGLAACVGVVSTAAAPLIDQNFGDNAQEDIPTLIDSNQAPLLTLAPKPSVDASGVCGKDGDSSTEEGSGAGMSDGEEMWEDANLSADCGDDAFAETKKGK